MILVLANTYIFQSYDTEDVFLHEEISKQLNKDENLLEEIKEKSENYNRAPENAYIDRVWKKTPGRYGRHVNIEKSYDNMKEEGQFKEDLLSYDEIKPKVLLKDLQPSPIYRAHPEKNAVALMINVSWGTEYIPNILKILEEEDVKATFFIDGSWAKKNTKYLKMIYEKNHLIGNHAYSHPNMRNLSKTDIRKEIVQTEDVIQTIINEKTSWFAPPSGSFNDTVVEVAHSENMETILWTVDTIDWRDPTVDEMLNRVLNKIHPGALILMHPTKPVANGLKQMIQSIKERDYELLTVEEILEEKW